MPSISSPCSGKQKQEKKQAQEWDQNGTDMVNIWGVANVKSQEMCHMKRNTTEGSLILLVPLGGGVAQAATSSQPKSCVVL